MAEKLDLFRTSYYLCTKRALTTYKNEIASKNYCINRNEKVLTPNKRSYNPHLQYTTRKKFILNSNSIPESNRVNKYYGQFILRLRNKKIINNTEISIDYPKSNTSFDHDKVVRLLRMCHVDSRKKAMSRSINIESKSSRPKNTPKFYNKDLICEKDHITFPNIIKEKSYNKNPIIVFQKWKDHVISLIKKNE